MGVLKSHGWSACFPMRMVGHLRIYYIFRHPYMRWLFIGYQMVAWIPWISHEYPFRYRDNVMGYQKCHGNLNWILMKFYEVNLQVLKYLITIWLFKIAMERSTIFKNGKPSISMGHGFHGYVSHNQRVNHLKKSHDIRKSHATCPHACAHRDDIAETHRCQGHDDLGRKRGVRGRSGRCTWKPSKNGDFRGIIYGFNLQKMVMYG